MKKRTEMKKFFHFFVRRLIGEGKMDSTKRQLEILKHLESVHFASVAELANMIYTSEATVRRDLQKLEQKGAIKSVYGGAVITE